MHIVSVEVVSQHKVTIVTYETYLVVSGLNETGDQRGMSFRSTFLEEAYLVASEARPFQYAPIRKSNCYLHEPQP